MSKITPYLIIILASLIFNSMIISSITGVICGIIYFGFISPISFKSGKRSDNDESNYKNENE